MNLYEAMRRDWNRRARDNAFHYIASWREDWDTQSFFQSGEEDYHRLVEPILSRHRLDPAGKRMLELGCGTGRMTRSFARQFGEVLALDVSSEMLVRAKELLPQQSNIQWLLEPGPGLSRVETYAVDFVFSYLVLQHLPSRELVLVHVREMLRVLKPGGVFLFQFNGSSRPTMTWKGRLVWGVLDQGWALGLEKLSRALAVALKLDPDNVGRTWSGPSIAAQDVRGEVERSSGVELEIQGENTLMAWCSGVKSGASR